VPSCAQAHWLAAASHVSGVSGGWQLGHAMVLKQPSAMTPQVAPSASHVVGVQTLAHAALPGAGSNPATHAAHVSEKAAETSPAGQGAHAA
jgi:hypothetical protein